MGKPSKRVQHLTHEDPSVFALRAFSPNRLKSTPINLQMQHAFDAVWNNTYAQRFQIRNAFYMRCLAFRPSKSYALVAFLNLKRILYNMHGVFKFQTNFIEDA